MSRVGNLPISLPDGVTVDIQENRLRIKGAKGELTTPVPAGIRFELGDDGLVARRDSDVKQVRALHGLARSLAANAVHGVSQGFARELQITGIGYRAAMQGSTLTMQLGFSHPVDFAVPEGITISVPEPTRIVVEGSDKQLVGETAAKIRSLRPPDAYKGKGIRYSDEIVHTKVGKSGVGAGV